MKVSGYRKISLFVVFSLMRHPFTKIIISMGCHHSCRYHAKRISCDIVWLLRYLNVKKKEWVTQTDNSPELRSLRELKKGLTDGLKGGFGGIVS